MTNPNADEIANFDISGKIGDLYPHTFPALDAARDLVKAAADINARQHAGQPVEPEDWSNLYAATADAKARLAEAAPEWPMYSYGRPAWLLWNAIGRELFAAGWSEDRIKEWLQSKSTRWALDMDLGDQIAAIGKAYAARILNERPFK